MHVSVQFRGNGLDTVCLWKKVAPKAGSNPVKSIKRRIKGGSPSGAINNTVHCNQKKMQRAWGCLGGHRVVSPKIRRVRNSYARQNGSIFKRPKRTDCKSVGIIAFARFKSCYSHISFFYMYKGL